MSGERELTFDGALLGLRDGETLGCLDGERLGLFVGEIDGDCSTIIVEKYYT